MTMSTASLSQPTQNAPLDDIIKKTIDYMGRIVKKTPLTPKLLSRPPFRYLHDLISEVIKTTGFAVGLYDEKEMNAESVKEKEAKIEYLLKMIHVLQFCTGVELKTNPLKIVAGLEAEETNVFLQLLAKAVLKKVDPSEAVQKVLNKEIPSKKSAAVEVPKTEAPKPASAQPTKPKAPTSASKPESKPTPHAREDSNKKPTSKTPEPGSRLFPAGQKSAPPKENIPSSNAPMIVPRDVQAEEEAQSASVRGSMTDVDHQPDPQEDQENKTPAMASMVVKKSQRPASARPPPPKIRATKTAVEEPIVAAPTILQEGHKDDDDAEFLVSHQEVAPEVPQLLVVGEGLGDDRHGGLVRKILETKKELQGSTNALEEDKNKEKLAGMPKEVVMARKETESLRESIQLLCRSTNPLGKTLDYIQEDVDAMNKELQYWKQQGALWRDKMQEESKISQEEYQELYHILLSIEDKMEEQYSRISTQKASVFAQQARISLLLSHMLQ